MMLLALLFAAPVHATDRAQRLEALVERGKSARAATIAARWLAHDPNAADADEVEAAWAEAAWRVVLVAPGLVDCQLYRKQFADGAHKRDAEVLEAELALIQAQELGKESVLLGVAAQYPGSAAGVSARALAETLAFQAMKGGTSAELHALQLRYPAGVHTAAIHTLELERAFSEAELPDDAASWRRLVDTYPEHPRAAEARERLRGAAYSALEAGSLDVAELWSFAADYPDTEQGWAAASRALDSGLAIRTVGEDLADGAVLATPLRTVDVDLGFAPSPAFALETSVRVRLASAAEWLPWDDAVVAMDPLLGLAVGQPASSGQVRDGSHLTWTSSRPICTPGADPLDIQVSVRLRRGTQLHEQTRTVSVTARCPGARELVYGGYGDALVGPIAILSWSPLAQSWSVSPTPSAPEAWSCSHVSSIDATGVIEACGTRELRVGWDGTLWIRAADPNARSTSRRDLVSIMNARRPLRVVPALPTAKLVDSSGSVVSRLQPGQLAFITPADTRAAYGGDGGESASSPIRAPDRPPEDGGVPLPEGAAPVITQVAPPDTAIRTMLTNLLGAETTISAQWITTDALPSAVAINSSSWGGVLLMTDVSGDRPWWQVVPLPWSASTPPSAWQAFDHEGHRYLRAVGASPVGANRTRCFTLRWAGDRWAAEVTDLL